MSEKEKTRLPHGDPLCVCNNGNDCWVDSDDPEYACYGIEFCSQGSYDTEKTTNHIAELSKMVELMAKQISAESYSGHLTFKDRIEHFRLKAREELQKQAFDALRALPSPPDMPIAEDDDL